MVNGLGFSLSIQVAFNSQVDTTTAAINQTSAIAAGNKVPTAAMMPFAGATAPSGWLLCNGAAVGRTTYADLFLIIGTTYGTGDGSTTFNIPDCRQRFPLGVAASGTGSTLGGTGGTIDHTHTGPSHSHEGATAGEAAHTHSVDPPTTTSGGPSAVTIEFTPVVGGGIKPGSETHTHDTNISAFTSGAGSSHAHNISADGTGATGTANPPFLALNFIIKT